MTSVPWKKASRVNKDIKKAREILDADHFGLEKVKDRIVEFLAVQKRTKKIKGPILCLVGPPGVGKTSLWVNPLPGPQGANMCVWPLAGSVMKLKSEAIAGPISGLCQAKSSRA